MHWASNTPVVQLKGDVELPAPEFSDPAAEPEGSAQYEAAKAAALSLLPFVGDPGDPVVVTIAGYAHEGHDPKGAENEVITITVAARPEERPVDPAPDAPAEPAPSPVEMAPAIDAETPFPTADDEEPAEEPTATEEPVA